MIAMAAAPTDTTAVLGGDAVVVRRRGKSKAPNFAYDGPVAVIRLELDVSGPVVRRRAEAQWVAVFRLRRALQRGAAARCRAYWSAHHERAADPKGLRERLGLSRKGIEAAAKSHIEASRWMRDHLTKAVGLHVADEVSETVDRHLFPDAARRRHGPPRIGSWWDFTRIPGRARRSQTPRGRRAGVDANVSNLALASFPDEGPGQLVVDHITCTAEQQRAAQQAARKATARQRALDRSRRNNNFDQYGPSPRQVARAARHEARGLPARQVINPGGARRARADGVPLRGYRHDTLSRRYQRTRSDHAGESRSASLAKEARAHEVAARTWLSTAM
jgi:hypothetical protein